MFKKYIMTINIFDPTRNYYRHRKEFDSIIQKIIESGYYIGGPEITQLENNLAEYTNSKYCLGVSSGTDALLMALMALDIKRGDEVITTPFTWISTSEVLGLLEITPVFVDIDEDTFNIDPSKIEAAITDKTKAILPVSLFGQMCEIDQIMEIAKKHNIYVIEDGAQSLGARIDDRPSCSMADISCTSFYPTKSLGCWGDGGACFTNNKELYEKLKAIRNHGGSVRDHHTCIGINGRLDTLQAGVLLVKLKYLNSDLEDRRKNALLYKYSIGDNPIIQLPKCESKFYHIYAQYTILIKNNRRDEFKQYLKNNDINVSVFYPTPLHLQPCFSYLNYDQGDFPISERLGNQAVSLPVYPELKSEEIERVIDIIRKWE